MKNFSKYYYVYLSVLTALLLLYLCGVGMGRPKIGLPSLKVLPASQDVYVIGNSMFGTGFDLSLARSKLPTKVMDFAYYNGHYSSMWHLAVTVGMGEESAPKTIVWGFRPTYAAYPSFRQNKDTGQQKFSNHMNAVHRSILSNAGDPAYHNSNISDEGSLMPGSQTERREVFEWVGSILTKEFTSYFEVLSGDLNILRALTNFLAEMLADATVKLGLSKGVLYKDDALIKPSDLLVRYTTNGRIQIADAQVIDNGEQFIKGLAVGFDESFLPEIVGEINKLGSRQLVVIFKPVTTFSKPLDAEIQRFYLDAIDYFEKNNLPFLDLMITEGLKPDMYAEGDHLNQEGSNFVTGHIVEKLKIEMAKP